MLVFGGVSGLMPFFNWVQSLVTISIPSKLSSVIFHELKKLIEENASFWAKCSQPEVAMAPCRNHKHG